MSITGKEQDESLQACLVVMSVATACAFLQFVCLFLCLSVGFSCVIDRPSMDLPFNSAISVREMSRLKNRRNHRSNPIRQKHSGTIELDGFVHSKPVILTISDHVVGVRQNVILSLFTGCLHPDSRSIFVLSSVHLQMTSSGLNGTVLKV